MYFKRAEQDAATYTMGSEMLRRKAGARMVMKSGPPDKFASAPRMLHAGLTKDEKTMALARFGNTLAFPQGSPQMKRLFGPRGYALRQDALVAQDTDTVSEEEDFEAWKAK